MACAFPTSLLFSEKLVAGFSSLDWCYACVGDVMLVVCAKDLRWTPERRSIYAAIDNMRLILAFLGKSHI